MPERADSDPVRTVVGKVNEPDPQPDPDPPAHSPLGPSAAERWLECTASVKHTAGMPDTETVFAAEGTAAHTVSEWVRESGKPASEFVGQQIEVGDFVFQIDAAWASAIQQFVDFVEELPGEAMYEERVHYTAFVEDGWGTADDIRIADGTCHFTDLKFGKGVMKNAEHNPQLMLYALGVFQDFGHLYDIQDFHLTIHQPRLDHVSEWTISVKDLLVWARDTVVPKAKEALETDGEFKAGEWCRFCPAKLTCEARAKAMEEEFLGDLDEPNEMPNYRLAEILDKAADVKAWLSDIEARALSELQKGHPVGDYKLVAGRSSRSWKDPEQAEKALRGARLKVKQIFPPVMISPAQAEKILGKKHPLFAEQVKKSQGKPTMVPGSDPRPPVQADAEEEFEDLENTHNAE